MIATRMSHPPRAKRLFGAGRLTPSSYGCGPHGASVISFTSWLITSGRNFEANPSTKSLFSSRPVRAPVAVILEFPDVHELIDHPRVGDEIPDQVLVVATLLQRRKPELGIELLRLGHFADVERVGTHFVECHRILLFLPSCPSGDVRHRQSLARA